MRALFLGRAVISEQHGLGVISFEERGVAKTVRKLQVTFTDGTTIDGNIMHFRGLMRWVDLSAPILDLPTYRITLRGHHGARGTGFDIPQVVGYLQTRGAMAA